MVMCALLGRAHGKELSAEGKVFASSYPIAYFAQRIMGNPDAVVYPDTEDNPIRWRPSVGTILSMQKARLILLNGAGYDRWAEAVSLPISRIINTSASFAQAYLNTETAVTHSHGPTGEHAHGNLLFSVWLDFSLATQQAEAVKDALIKAKLGSEKDLNNRFLELKKDLSDLDRAFQEITRKKEFPAFFASHPLYSYFGRQYGLNVHTVMLNPATPPNDQTSWDAVSYLHERHQAIGMIWKSPPTSEVTARLHSMGIRSVVFDPCLTEPNEGDFLTVMRQNLNNLRRAFQ